MVINEGIPIQRGTLQVGQPMSGTISKDVSVYEGKTVTVQFNLISSAYCGNDGHFNTYLWIDNVTTSCTPNWKCEQPLNGYKSDVCGNRRPNSLCNPLPSDKYYDCVNGECNFTVT